MWVPECQARHDHTTGADSWAEYEGSVLRIKKFIGTSSAPVDRTSVDQSWFW
jgi:hypothetical protein